MGGTEAHVSDVKLDSRNTPKSLLINKNCGKKSCFINKKSVKVVKIQFSSGKFICHFKNHISTQKPSNLAN